MHSEFKNLNPIDTFGNIFVLKYKFLKNWFKHIKTYMFVIYLRLLSCAYATPDELFTMNKNYIKGTETVQHVLENIKFNTTVVNSLITVENN